MANQPDKRQQFRFWYPFWGNAPSRTPAPPPASRPSQRNQSKVSQTTTPDQPQPIKRTSRTSSLSSSSSSSSSSSPTKQNQQRRASRATPSPLPSPTQSPSRRSSRFDQVKQKTKSESPQMTPSPSQGAEESLKASNQQDTVHEVQKMPDNGPIEPIAQQGAPDEEKMSDNGPIKPMVQQGTTHEEKMSQSHNQPMAQLDPKTIEEHRDIKPTSQASMVEKEGISQDLEKIEPKSIPFDSLISDMPIKTVISNKNPSENDEEEEGSKDHEVQLDDGTGSTIEEGPETRHEENNQTHNKAHQEKSVLETDHQENKITRSKRDNIKHMTTPTQAENPRETIKEIVEPIPDANPNPKGIIKDMAAVAWPSGVNNLTSNYKDKTTTTNNSSSDNRLDEMERENPNQKEKIVTSSSSSRISFQKNIKDGISKLVQKINTDNAFNPGSKRSGTSIITLAGENKGASMYIGHESEGHNNIMNRKLGESAAMPSTGSNGSTGKEELEDEKDSTTSANVNSNVQSINNSMLQESRCDTRDPGVHLRVSSRMKKESGTAAQAQ